MQAKVSSVVYWSPPEWTACCIPLDGPDAEIVTTDNLIAALHAHVDTATEADTTAICAALHVAHLLMTMQGLDGQWPDRWNARTGEVPGEGRTRSPVGLLRRLDALTDAAEFETVCHFAEAGRSGLPSEPERQKRR